MAKQQVPDTHPGRTRRWCSIGLLCLMMLSWVGYAVFVSFKLSDEQIFEQWIGLRLTPDVTILDLTRRGGGDFHTVSICFRASPETVSEIIATRGLQPATEPADAPGCLSDGGQTFVRLAGAGSGTQDQTRIHGFSMTSQQLTHDASTGTAYFAFHGSD